MYKSEVIVVILFPFSDQLTTEHITYHLSNGKRGEICWAVSRKMHVPYKTMAAEWDMFPMTTALESLKKKGRLRTETYLRKLVK